MAMTRDEAIGHAVRALTPVYSLNAPNTIVTHAALSASYLASPLCGWARPSEKTTLDKAAVDCKDCLAALD
jgi:hypothetical protein